ncbi:MAG: SPOR domain-containing protein [Bryobacterales bacterium]|nr:SPOR domain-containing protein [Bryobacterales bacterium]
MPTNEEGEFELVLGNKQLLSVFFLIVLLLGVFFSMGYIVGRNTAPVNAQIASTRQGGGTLTVDPPLASTPPPADLSKPSPVSQTTEVTPPLRPTSEASKAESKPEPPKVAKVEPKPEPKVEPKPPKPEPKQVAKVEPKPEPKKKPEPPPVKAESKPVSKGSYYLQVAAVREKDANTLKEVLGQRGFSTATEPVPEKNLVRVLVGPFKDSDAMNQAKDKLSDFKPIPRKM